MSKKKVTSMTVRTFNGITYRMSHQVSKLVDKLLDRNKFFTEQQQKLADTIIEWHAEKYFKFIEESKKEQSYKTPVDLACELLEEVGRIIHDEPVKPKTGLFVPKHLQDNPKGKIILTDG